MVDAHRHQGAVHRRAAAGVDQRAAGTCGVAAAVVLGANPWVAGPVAQTPMVVAARVGRSCLGAGHGSVRVPVVVCALVAGAQARQAVHHQSHKWQASSH